MRNSGFYILVILCCCALTVLAASAGTVPDQYGGSGTNLQAASRLVVTTSPVFEKPTTSSHPMGALILDSVPSGASVYIEGSYVGTTPFTLRTLSTGNHAVVLKMAGFQDYSRTVTIMTGGVLQETWTLVPITTVPTTTTVRRELMTTTQTLYYAPPTTTANPGSIIGGGKPNNEPVSAIAPTTTTPAPPFIINANTTAQHNGENAGQVFARRVTKVGNYYYSPLFGTDSPYHPAYTANNIGPITNTILETDAKDNTEGDYFTKTFPRIPLWTDSATLSIDIKDASHVGNFRFYTDQQDVKFYIWQVSRFNFANDAAHWQNRYIPGLVASGTVSPYHTDENGFQYFRINFARVAKQNPGDPPYYDGIALWEPAGPAGRVRPVQAWRIPFTLGVVTLKEQNFSPVRFSFPTGIQVLPEGENTESERLNMNEGMDITCVQCENLREATPLEAMIEGGDQTYYVRIIPILNSGKAALPSLPVKQIVTRPKTCPVTDHALKPPSARIVWYMKPVTSPVPQSLVYHWLAVPVPADDKFAPSYWHHTVEFPQPPGEPNWLGKIVNFFEELWGYFSWFVSQEAKNWEIMKSFVVKGTSVLLSYTVSANQVKCSEIDGCETLLATALNAAMAAAGLPPTLPNADELGREGASYLIKLSADELGAGEAYSEMEGFYDNYIKDNEAAQMVQGGAGDAAKKLIEMQQAKRDADYLAGKGRCLPDYTCNTRIPDSIFNAVHPASVMVHVVNTNNQPTDRLFLNVTDSKGLFTPERAVLPKLQPGEDISVPVILHENYDQYRKDHGGPCEFNSTATNNNEVETSCPESYWNSALKEAGPVTFKVTFDDDMFMNMDESSSGKAPQDGYMFPNQICSSNIKIRYPDGWYIYTTGRTYDANMWDLLFEYPGPNGETITTSSKGFLRNKS